MENKDTFNYKRIAEAIDFMRRHFKEQPGLEEVAAKVHLSPYHFQRLFTEWAGTSPKKFLQYMSLEHAKKVLREQQATLAEAAAETGLSGTGRLHDLFVTIEGMTPAEYKHGGSSLTISYSMAESPFGTLLVASTSRGICHMAFTESLEEGMQVLKSHFPNASFRDTEDELQKNALAIFTGDWSRPDKIRLHLKGTEFQLRVWEALLKIPSGHLTTYGAIAGSISKPNASRAVGTAIGSNPIAFLIPCHRVIQSSGIIGGYMWGSTRKAAMIGWEAARTSGEEAEQQE